MPTTNKSYYDAPIVSILLVPFERDGKIPPLKLMAVVMSNALDAKRLSAKEHANKQRREMKTFICLEIGLLSDKDFFAVLQSTPPPVDDG